MISPNPLGDDVDWFGLAYHGLYVVEKDGQAAYIQLSDGRKIYSSQPYFYIRQDFTALVDNGMPPVETELDEPGAEIWNVAIMGGEAAPYEVYPFEYRTTVNYRKNTETGEFVRVQMGRPSFSVFSDREVYVRGIYLGAGPDRVRIPRSAHGIPADILMYGPTTGHLMLDVSPDGRKALFLGTFYDRQEPVCIVEVTYTPDFSDWSASVVANYADLHPAENTVYGDPLEAMAMVIDGDTGSVQHIGYYDGIGDDYPPPRYVISMYGIGSSSASASGESIIGAWYNGSGQVELVRARWTASNELNVDGPVRGESSLGSPYWVTPSSSKNTTTLTIKAGGREGGTVSVTAVETWDVYTVSDVVTSSTGESISRSDAATYSGTFIFISPSTRASASPVVGFGPISYSAPGVGDMMLRAARLSNKLYAPAVKVTRTLDNHVEDIVGDCLTPTGVDFGIKRSGNTYGGADPYFMSGAYNPVTGEVERNRTDGATYTWV